MKQKKLLWIFCILAFCGFAFIVACNIYILSFGKNSISSVDAVEPRPLAIIFGGGMKEDGVTMSEMQEDRVKRGIELYKAGKVQKLLMTGDDGANNGNEVGAMEKYAIAAGVPDDAVDIDPHGYNTFKSCDRAANLYNVTSTIVVSQSFHLHRIAYFCSHEQGINVEPVSADLREYGTKGRWVTAGLREWLARVKAVVSGKSESIGNVVVY